MVAAAAAPYGAPMPLFPMYMYHPAYYAHVSMAAVSANHFFYAVYRPFLILR
jgi:hypothetical protein